MPAPPELSFPGDLPTARWDTTFGEGLPLTILFPNTGAAQSYPLIVFTAGWNQTRASYVGYATQLAQWGYVCAIRAYPTVEIGGLNIGTVEEHVDQIIRLIDWSGAQSLDPASPLYGKVDPENVGATGHSHGGKVAVAAALYDPRIKAVVDIDGNNESGRFLLADKMRDIHVPIMWLASDSGHRCAEFLGPLGEVLYPYALAPTVEATVVGSSHIDYLEFSQGFNVIGQYVCGGGELDPDVARSFAYRYLISWFNVYLQGKTEFEENYLGARAEEDAARGDVVIRAKMAETPEANRP